MCFLRLAILVLFLLCGCGRDTTRPDASRPPAREPVATESTAAANAVLFRALALVGTPYRYGGNTPESGFDCSGLVGYVFRDAAGIQLPRTSAALGAMDGPEISQSRLQSGDLVLFASGRRISHVGIYVGEGRFVHAPNSGGTVRLDSIDSPGWRETFRTGKRILD
ncbi:C40 family peptidase [Dokdonella sp.]|uniref:C40 family peptidase n=1 Tax=Dokdonella sp. TaxID=2291710 RepID=UPI003C3F135B